VFVRVIPRVGLGRGGVSTIVRHACARSWRRSAHIGCGTPPPVTCCAGGAGCIAVLRPLTSQRLAAMPVDIERLRMMARPWPDGAAS
jgi:hypothetical protein